MRYCLFLAVCPLLSGCFAFAYPSATQVPAVAVAEGDVTAFHVSERSSFFGLLSFPVGVTTLEEAPLIEGKIAARQNSHVNYWCMAFLISAWNAHHESVRLYRPGYETVVIESRPLLLSWWQREPERVTWKKADTLEEREKAIGELYKNYSYFLGGVAPHAFIADEYARLAASDLAAGKSHAADRKRLHERAEAARQGNLRSPFQFSPSEPMPEATDAQHLYRPRRYTDLSSFMPASRRATPD